MQADKELKKSEEWYRRLAENAKDMIYRMSLPEGRYEYVSPASVDIFGYSAEEFYNTPKLVQKVIHPDWQKYFEEQWKNLKVGDMPPFYEYQIIHKSGQTRWLHQRNVLICDDNDQPVAIEGIVTDITDRKLTEEKLRESEEKYRLLVENIPSVTWTTNEQGITTFISPNVEKIFGFSQEEIYVGKDSAWFERIHPEDVERVEDSFKKLFSNKGKFDIEYRIQRKDGQWIWVHDMAIMAYEKDDLKYAYGVFSDITDRKQAEDILHKYKNIISSSTDMIALLDRQYTYLAVNKAYFSAFNLTNEQLIGKTVAEVFGEEVFNSTIKSKADACLSGEVVNYDGWFNFPGFGLRYMDITYYPYYNKESKVMGLVAFGRDITKQKKAEEEKAKLQSMLMQSQKMESLGLLAGGVAHDLNNVLAGIVSYPELILLDLPKDSSLRKPLQTIKESGDRAVAIVQDLLTIARGVVTNKEPLKINSVVNDYLQSPEFQKLKHYHPGVMIDTNLDSDLFNINGSYIHIRKIVMNLVSNASEAIEGTGKVTISTMNCYLDHPLKIYDDIKIGKYAVLSVSDDGSGIPSEDLKRIFEPFYSKKVMGRSGTGLGLAVVWNVIKEHDGYINVTSDGKGTTFDLYFPITRAEPSNKDLEIPIDDYKGHGEKILVVDDVKSQRDVTCMMLEKLGYEVDTVPNGEKAIEYLMKHTVDLVLLDMIMDPGINGRETYERIIKIHPYQRAIVVSGFTETNDMKVLKKLGVKKFIKKPLTLQRIGSAIKDELKN